MPSPLYGMDPHAFRGLCERFGLSGRTNHKSRRSPGKPRVVCFGDSITAKGFPELFAKSLSVEGINAGVGGYDRHGP